MRPLHLGVLSQVEMMGTLPLVAPAYYLLCIAAVSFIITCIIYLFPLPETAPHYQKTNNGLGGLDIC